MARNTQQNVDFSWTQWDPDTIRSLVPQIIEEKKRRYEAVKQIPPEERTFDNTIAAIETSGNDIVEYASFINFLMYISPVKETRETAKEAVDALSEAMIDIEYDEGMYRAVMEYAAKNEPLSGDRLKLFQDMVRDYKRMGFELPEATRTVLKARLKELERLETNFSKNINDYDDSITLTPEETEGLPPAFLQSLNRDENGNYLVTLKYPEFFPFLENARNEAKRKELSDKKLKSCPENMSLLEKILHLRENIAHMLGYANHAAYILEVRMAKTPEHVRTFLFDLAERLRGKTSRELQELETFKREETGNPSAVLGMHDVRYYENQVKKHRLNVDNEKVREYFPLETVIRGMFKIYETLLGVRLAEVQNIPTWHPDVKTYEVHEASDDSLIGYFMLDLHPREGKYNHAAVWDIVPGRIETDPSGNETIILPVAGMAANFTKPTSESPSLLTHDEVETFFHEFGHVMHEVLSKVYFKSQSGTSVTRDFVEAPSQMLENWVWDKEMLKMLSGHYLRPEEPLPDEMLENMLRAKTFMEGYLSMRQLTFGILDFTIHTENAYDRTAEVYNDIVREYTGLIVPPDSIFPASFGHLMGYSAGYYGYMWSKVYSSDMFTRFRQEGILNPHTGRDYRSWILEKGSSMEEIDLVRGFLGREPNNEAFLKEIGVTS